MVGIRSGHCASRCSSMDKARGGREGGESERSASPGTAVASVTEEATEAPKA